MQVQSSTNFKLNCQKKNQNQTNPRWVRAPNPESQIVFLQWHSNISEKSEYHEAEFIGKIILRYVLFKKITS